MEQFIDLSGINWQQYYKNVFGGKNHTRASIYIIPESDKDIEKIIEFAEKDMNIRWVIDSVNIENPWTIMSPYSNVLLIKWDELPEKEKVEYWKNIDYALIDERNYSVSVPALLSGVEIVPDFQFISDNIIGQDFSLRDQPLKRIESFEKGKAILDIFSK